MSFKAQIDDFILKSTELTAAIVKDASQEMAIQANTTTGNGGRMRVDTGFLRNSIAANIGSLPSGQSVKPEAFNQQSWNPSEVVSVINRLELGQTLYIGWTAEYARFRENQDFFARTAAQNWPDLVTQSVLKLKSRLA